MYADIIIHSNADANAEGASRKKTAQIKAIYHFICENSKYFDLCIYTRQAGEWLEIKTRVSNIALAMASVASVTCINACGKPKPFFNNSALEFVKWISSLIYVTGTTS